MSVIGSFGNFVFEASSSKAHSFSDLQRESGARLSSTDIIAGDPVVEFLGPDTESISFAMQLCASLGVNPETETGRLHLICSNGEARTLIIGGRVIGNPGDKWLIEKLSAKHGTAFVGGQAQLIELSVSLKKYVPWRSKWKSN